MKTLLSEGSAIQAWDAINDPLIGNLIDRDRRKYKMGKFKTYILIGACGLLIAGAAVFLPFPNASVVVKAILRKCLLFR